MPSMFFIRPRKGLRIADPESGQYLPEAGRLMPRSGFWLRRLDDGDVALGVATQEATHSDSSKVTRQTSNDAAVDIRNAAGAANGYREEVKKTASAKEATAAKEK